MSVIAVLSSTVNGLILQPSAVPRAAVRMEAPRVWDWPAERTSGMRVPQSEPDKAWGDHLSDYIAPDVATGATPVTPKVSASYSYGAAFGRSGMCVPSAAPDKAWGDHLSDYIAPDVAAGDTPVTPKVSASYGSAFPDRSGMCVPDNAPDPTKTWGDHLSY